MGRLRGDRVDAALLFLNYKGCLGEPTIWSNVGAVLLLVLPWFWFRREFHKNAEEHVPSGNSRPGQAKKASGKNGS
jgi:hypothetical protein